MWQSLIKSATPITKIGQNIIRNEVIFHQQLRTTYILKRRWAPRLNKKGFPPKSLKSRNYVYELVKNTNMEKQQSIDLILTSYVDRLGNVGDKVNVKSNIAYHNLLMPGLAVYATPENLEKYKDVELKSVKHYSSSNVYQLLQKLATLRLSVVMNKDSPWTLQPWHIKASFRKCAFEVPEYAITLPDKPIKGPDMNLEGKEFYVTVTINKTEQIKVRCRIHHWSTDIRERLPYVEEFWREPGELLFPEDQEVEKLQEHLRK